MSFFRRICRRAPFLVFFCMLLILSSTVPACERSVLPQKKLVVVTTSNIVADWVSAIGGDGVYVFPLLPIGADPHTYQPGAADVARVAEAGVLFAVGLGLEHTWLTRLITNAAKDSKKVVTLGDQVQPLPVQSADSPEDAWDPHFWWDPLRVKLAVSVIVSELSRIDADNAPTYGSRGTSYEQEVDDLSARIAALTDKIPPQRRKIVTSHETMQYFAERYGYEAVGSIFPGISTDREPSAAELAKLAERVRELGVDVIFTEPIVTDRLARSIASETGARVVRLYSDSLGPAKSEAATYIRMMDANINLIYEALK